MAGDKKAGSIMVKINKKDLKNIQIGIDIGTYSVKSVAISHESQMPRLENFSIKPINGNTIKAIADAHAELGIPKTMVVFSVSGPAVIVRYIELPLMTDDELKSAARFEAEKVMPYNINEVELDALKIENLEGNKMRVVIVAAKKELIASRIKMLSEAGLEPAIIDVDSFAIANAFANTGTGCPDACGLINIGFSRSNLHIIKNGKSYFSRDIDIGSRHFISLVAGSMSLPEKEAAQLIYDRLMQFNDISDDEKKPIAGPLSDILIKLVDEIRLSFDFYENCYASVVGKIYISGGMAISEIVMDFLKEHIGKDALRWDPLINLEVPEGITSKGLKPLSAQLVTAIGLGLRRMD
jgi:type IV pilus assembly protein PilM